MATGNASDLRRMKDGTYIDVTDVEPRTIDLTPTWRGILPGLLAVVANGETVEARKAAEGELTRMAALADRLVEEMSPATEPYTFLRPGTRLANGATVIDGRAVAKGEGIVLALLPGPTSTPHRFVTWRIDLVTGDTVSGDYTATFEGAIRSYGARTGFVPEALGNGIDIDDR